MQRPELGTQAPAAKHSAVAVHVTPAHLGVPTQIPAALHASLVVASPSLHGVAGGRGLQVQVPLLHRHVDA